MTIDELRAAAERVDRFNRKGEMLIDCYAGDTFASYGARRVAFECDKNRLADFAAAILARLSDAEVEEILDRETRSEA